ncbi:MAG: indolepyruvate ferredoxin oxidoreductase subunit alpha [Clostridiales bacterium]|nr:indolepyruvate ferredoxin oxidoreductase subunit alpha [Clostridiales bacterium]
MVLMSGNEAVAQGAYEAGVNVSSAYPGTPSTDISEVLAKYDGVYAEWAPNEKVALEVAIGAAMSGARSMAVMKHVGLNVAADPLFTVSYTGVNGGLVVVVADDPGMHSSQNEQDTRMYARASHIPLLEPADSADAKEYMKAAFTMSEKYDTPVILRMTMRVSHSQSLVELCERENVPVKEYVKDIQKNVMMPGMARKRHVIVEDRMNRIAEDYSNSPLNTVEYNDKSIGIITSGCCYNYVKEALPEASVLKLGVINPLPRKLIEEFAANVKELYIVEELETVIEEQVKYWGIQCKGKELFTRQGEYSVAMIKKAFGKEADSSFDKVNVPMRPPVLCPGCPHRAVYSVLKKMKFHATGDIGCYTLGAVAPLEGIDTTVCMGASIGMLHGMEKSKGRDFVRNWVAVIGDSTFIHSGITGLVNAVYNKSAITVMILDNRTTGMTGHQQHPATGSTLQGEPAPALNIEELCKNLGVEHVTVIDPFDMKGLEELIKKEAEYDGVSVIISRRPCALLVKTKEPPVFIDTEKCTKCTLCMRIGCPAIRKLTDRMEIDTSLCNGCTLCMQQCRFGAIKIAGK